MLDTLPVHEGDERGRAALSGGVGSDQGWPDGHQVAGQWSASRQTLHELEKRREVLRERLRDAAVGEPLDSETEWSTRAELSEIAFLLNGPSNAQQVCGNDLHLRECRVGSRTVRPIAFRGAPSVATGAGHGRDRALQLVEDSVVCLQPTPDLHHRDDKRWAPLVRS